jgi:hypothetical protein
MDRHRQKTEAELRKEEADKTMERRGTIQRKRLHVLRNSEKLAFRGWKDVSEPWTFVGCCEYIEWCDIGKVFLEEHHNKHRRFSKTNLKYCLDAELKQRCIEVYQVLYNHVIVHRNDASLTICRMVWAELKLGKVVDWTTLKAAPGIHIATQRDIPRGVLKFPEGGLSVRRTIPEKADPYVSSDSSPDSDSDGSQPMNLSNNLAAIASRRLRMRKRTWDDEHLPLLQVGDVHLGQHTAGASNMAGASNVAGASDIAGTSVAMGASISAGANAFPLAVALLGANITPGASGSRGANVTSGLSGSGGAIQPIAATYP